MYTLANDTLEVSILDPVADQERFGPRYCTGGYIFQITDSRHGALLSGPTYPDSFNWFDGQGIPDAFNLSPLRDPAAPGSLALIPGIGTCDLESNKVVEFCTWDIERTDTMIRMVVMHSFQNHSLRLERTVELHSRTVRSTTRLANLGGRATPIRWYPHPFFPHQSGDELCRFNVPLSIPESASYELATSGYIVRKGWPWTEGHFQALDHDAQTNLVVLQKHPLLGLVAATCSYVPSFFPIWGNQYTFSWEPYFERTIVVGQTATWWIDYDF